MLSETDFRKLVAEMSKVVTEVVDFHIKQMSINLEGMVRAEVRKQLQYPTTEAITEMVKRMVDEHVTVGVSIEAKFPTYTP